MQQIVEVRKTYKYRLYKSRRDYRSHNSINIAGIIWNHITALQKRYYRLTGKHISGGRLKKHVAKLRMKTERYKYWHKVGSQAVQAIIERHEQTYKRFFRWIASLSQGEKVQINHPQTSGIKTRRREPREETPQNQDR